MSFFHNNAATHGGYVYLYSADLSLRQAEGIPGPDTIWVQPPGTPAVGEAFLDAYEATGSPEAKEAALDAFQGTGVDPIALGRLVLPGSARRQRPQRAYLYRRNFWTASCSWIRRRRASAPGRAAGRRGGSGGSKRT
ncbi:MAG: hypothetical protein R3F11_04380 [Verrucomicrobiales bacterium]